MNRQVLHAILARNFNPWTVIESIPANTRVGKNIIFMMYAGGPNFSLIEANLVISIANYNANDVNIEDFWVEKYN